MSPRGLVTGVIILVTYSSLDTQKKQLTIAGVMASHGPHIGVMGVVIASSKNSHTALSTTIGIMFITVMMASIQNKTTLKQT